MYIYIYIYIVIIISSNYCKLCLTEKFYVIESLADKNLLSKKSELVSKCRHQNKLLFCNVYVKVCLMNAKAGNSE